MASVGPRPAAGRHFAPVRATVGLLAVLHHVDGAVLAALRAPSDGKDDRLVESHYFQQYAAVRMYARVYAQTVRRIGR